MILYVNERNEIKDVNMTTDTSLTALEVIDTEMNPFKDWSIPKICCYKVTVNDGKVTSFSPYIDSNLIEHFDRLGKMIESLQEEKR